MKAVNPPRLPSKNHVVISFVVNILFILLLIMVCSKLFVCLKAPVKSVKKGHQRSSLHILEQSHEKQDTGRYPMTSKVSRKAISGVRFILEQSHEKQDTGRYPMTSWPQRKKYQRSVSWFGWLILSAVTTEYDGGWRRIVI